MLPRVTSTRLNDDGTAPVDIDMFTIRVIVLANDSKFSLRIWVGMGSRPHVLDGDRIMTRWISFSNVSSKDVRWCSSGAVCKFSSPSPLVTASRSSSSRMVRTLL